MLYVPCLVFDTIKKLAKSSKIHNIGHGTMASCNHALFCSVPSTKYKCSKLFFILFCSRFINLPHDITVFVSVSNFRQASCTALLGVLH